MIVSTIWRIDIDNYTGDNDRIEAWDTTAHTEYYTLKELEYRDMQHQPLLF